MTRGEQQAHSSEELSATSPQRAATPSKVLRSGKRIAATPLPLPRAGETDENASPTGPGLSPSSKGGPLSPSRAEIEARALQPSSPNKPFAQNAWLPQGDDEASPKGAADGGDDSGAAPASASPSPQQSSPTEPPLEAATPGPLHQKKDASPVLGLVEGLATPGPGAGAGPAAAAAGLVSPESAAIAELLAETRKIKEGAAGEPMTPLPSALAQGPAPDPLSLAHWCKAPAAGTPTGATPLPASLLAVGATPAAVRAPANTPAGPGAPGGATVARQQLTRDLNLALIQAAEGVLSPADSARVTPASFAYAGSSDASKEGSPKAKEGSPQGASGDSASSPQPADQSPAAAAPAEVPTEQEGEAPAPQGPATLLCQEEGTSPSASPADERAYANDLGGGDSLEALKKLKPDSPAGDSSPAHPVPMPVDEPASPVEQVELGSPEGVGDAADEPAGDPVGDLPAYEPRGAAASTHLQEKIRAAQAGVQWGAAGAGKLHKSRVQRDKEAAAAARRGSGLSSADREKTRRLVQGALGRAVQMQGRGLGESLVRPVHRLERAKAAAAQEQKEAAAQQAAAGAEDAPRSARSHQAAVAASGPGLGDMKRPVHRLEREQAAAQKLPSYMRATKSSSQGAAARAAAEAAAAFGGAGLGGGAQVHKSRLERDVEAARAKPDPRKPGPRLTTGAAASSSSFGQGLKVHKSRLEREKEAWGKAAAAAEQKRHRAPGAQAFQPAPNSARASKPASATPTSPRPRSARSHPLGGSDAPVPSYMRRTSAFQSKVDDEPKSGGAEAFNYVPN